MPCPLFLQAFLKGRSPCALGLLWAGILLPGCLLQAQEVNLSAVKIVTDDDPPYVVVDQNNVITGGITVGKIYKVLKKLKLPTSTVESAPWARSYNLAKTLPNTMIFPIAKTSERLKYLDFTFKIINSEVYFYKLKIRSDINLKSLADAKKYSICVVLDDYRLEYLQSEGFPRLDATSDSTINVKRFINGRCDLIPSTEIGMLSKLKSLGTTVDLIEKSIELDKLDSALYAAFNKNTSPAIIDQFKEAARNTN